MRRLVAVGVFIEIALLIIGVTWIGAITKDDGASASGSTAAAPAGVDQAYRLQGDGSGTVVNIDLVATETTQTIAEGVDYQVWTFDGTTPGPVIRVQLGDTIHFTLHNASTLGLAHSIDFHAAQTPWDKNYQPVQPGQTASFDWVARFPGVFMYHCGVPPVMQHISNGMYGAIVVEPPGLAPAREYVMVSSEFYASDKPANGVYVGDVDKMTAVTPTQVVFDGGFNRYLDAPLEAKPNELIRLWVMNAGPSLTTAFHVIGALFDETHADGNPANTMYGLQTYNIAPGSGAMFELRIPDAGLYPFVTHSFAYTGLGAVGVIKIDPSVGDRPSSYPTMADPFSAGTEPFKVDPNLGGTTTAASNGDTQGGMTTMPGMPAATGDSAALDVSISGFSPSELEVKEGTISLTLKNLDAFAHDFVIDELGVKVPIGASATVKTSFDAKPGVYTFYCSIPGHREAGMEGTLTVLPGAGH
jgi:nitrite reductase (NO-forming)